MLGINSSPHGIESSWGPYWAKSSWVHVGHTLDRIKLSPTYDVSS